MKKKYSFPFIAIILILFTTVEGFSQGYFVPGKYKNPPDQPEIIVGVGAPKIKSNYPSYNSKYKPPDWWTGGMEWARKITGMFRWFFSPGLKSNDKFTPIDDNPLAKYLYGLSFEEGQGKQKSTLNDTEADHKNSYLTYGVGLGIGTKGGKFTYQDGTAKESIFYLQVPIVMVRYNYEMNGGSSVFAEAGPYYAIALGGHYKDEEGKEKLKFGNDPDKHDYRRGDWGLKLGIGYKLSSSPILISLVADLGLRNLTPGGDKEVKTKNQVLGLQLGYRF